MRQATTSLLLLNKFCTAHAKFLTHNTNKFGSNGLPQARDKLFAWAYVLRVQMARVQFVSVANRARGKDDAGASPFVLMRNAVTGQAIQRLTVKLDKRDDAEHEKELLTFIQQTSTP